MENNFPFFPEVNSPDGIRIISIESFTAEVAIFSQGQFLGSGCDMIMERPQKKIKEKRRKDSGFILIGQVNYKLNDLHYSFSHVELIG